MTNHKSTEGTQMESNNRKEDQQYHQLGGDVVVGGKIITCNDNNRLLLMDYQDRESSNFNSSSNYRTKEQQELQNNRTTDAQTMMHILKANIGTGILAMPNAFKNVGLWSGFILVPIIGAICIHCMNILIASHNYLCDRFNYESLDYDQVAALGLACGPKFARRLAKRAHIVVTTFLIFTQIGFCCVYIMFVVENLQLALYNIFSIDYSNTTLLLIVFPIIGLTSCTSNLKHLARISTLANVLQLIGLSLIFFDLIQFHTYQSILVEPGTTIATTSTTSTNLINETGKKPNIEVSQFLSPNIGAGLPLFFATAVYAFEGIGVVLPLIKEMQHPDHISGSNGVLNTSMTMIALLYMGIGFFGYSKYGQFVEGSITLNLPQTTLNEIVRLVFAIAIGLSYSLQFYVPWTIIWPQIDEALFYSYRPRVSRDKLQILSKLSAENQWAIEDCSFCNQSQNNNNNINHQTRSSGMGRNDEDGTNVNEHSTITRTEQIIQLDGGSNASTLATSYTVSTCLQSTTTGRSRSISKQLLGGSLAQYGSMSQRNRQCRNRLEDVTEQEDCDSMPEVQWRPPPRSMRGKRKLVRYTVILVFVSFTFVAAALIPRLDLFISLIGALASSCLAIIFPAIIQMCTFWSSDPHQSGRDKDDDFEQEDNYEESGDSDGKFDSSASGKLSRKRKRIRDRDGILWTLFICKNFLLIVFGILGLITGSWISISELGASYMGIAETE